MSSFEGIYYTNASRGEVIRPFKGFAGIYYTLPGFKPIKVIDKNGRGLKNVKVLTINGGSDFEVTTDSRGNAFTQIDDNSRVMVIKDSITREIQFTSGVNLIIEIDLPIIPS